ATYTLSLHDALPISQDARTVQQEEDGQDTGGQERDAARARRSQCVRRRSAAQPGGNLLDEATGAGFELELPRRFAETLRALELRDRKSTRLNSSHVS